MNKVILLGRTTKDIELTYMQNEKATAVAKFSLAVQRKFKNADGKFESDFINCVAFGKTAETLNNYVPKGTKIVVEGEWRTGNYTNKEGNKVYTNDCNVSNFEFVESKNANTRNNDSNNRPSGDRSFMDIPDNIENDLPFE